MVSTNVELKARDPDPAATAARCVALGAQDRGVLVQRDTYFARARGRLKLREQEGEGSELIVYRRADSAGPEESRFVRAPAGNPEALREALDTALGTIVVVSKQRRVFIWEGVRIHLDEVDGLGTFIELEAPFETDRAEADRRVARLRSELAVDDGALVAVGYADLLMDAPEVLLRAAEAAMLGAYAPYSQFKVGAAVRGRSGAIYAAANVENASYSQAQCAEASALGALVAAGESAITAAAVVAERVEICPPCGGCRQRLAEFGTARTPVYLGRPGQAPLMLTLEQLLPHSFGRGELEA